MLPILLIGPLQAATWVVDASGGGDFTTLADAADVAEYGDTVEVRAGTYYDQNVYFEGVTLVGDGPETTVIQASGKHTQVLWLYYGATVSGLSFSMAGEWGLALSAGADYDLFEIDNCWFEDASDGVALFPGGQSFIYVHDSVFVGNEYAVSSGESWGGTLLVENNLFYENEKAIDAGWMSWWFEPDEVTVLHNTFVRNETALIQYAKWDGDSLFANNIFYEDKWAWSIYDYGGATEVTGNVVYTATPPWTGGKVPLDVHDNDTGMPNSPTSPTTATGPTTTCC